MSGLLDKEQSARFVAYLEMPFPWTMRVWVPGKRKWRILGKTEIKGWKHDHNCQNPPRGNQYVD